MKINHLFPNMKNLYNKISYPKIFGQILIALILLFGVFTFAGATYSSPSGTLSVSNSTINVGDPITLTITGYDNNGLINLSTFFHQQWHAVNVSGISATRTWQVIENSPDVYSYCGKVFGYEDTYWFNGVDTVNTSPACVEVTVLGSAWPTPTPYPPYPYCTNECQYYGETRCYNNYYRQTCGNYDSDSCLEWSSFYYDSSCNPAPVCECSTGPCCDGCHYRTTNVSCNLETQTEYSCPWGSICGTDVGKRTKTRLQYCSGNSAQCDGRWGDWLAWTNWTNADYCSSNEVCVIGNPLCQYSSSCVQPTSTYIKHFKKDCYNGNLYWFDSNDLRQDEYRKCSDDNECTIDSCQNGGCVNELKCDGTTCKTDSENYCKSCEHCGDKICNCGETIDSCADDCQTGGLVVAILGKKGKETIKWLKNLEMRPGESIDFLVVVKNSSEENINDINVKTEIPSEIAYKGDLKIEGNLVDGDIKSGINIGSLAAHTVKAITFKGKVQSGNIPEVGKEVIALAKAGNLSDTHVLKIDLKTSRGFAGFSIASIKFFVQQWYFWVFAILALVYLFFIVFRKLFSITPYKP